MPKNTGNNIKEDENSFDNEIDNEIDNENDSEINYDMDDSFDDISRAEPEPNPKFYEMSYIKGQIEEFKNDYGFKVSCKKYVDDVNKRIEETRKIPNMVPDLGVIRENVFLDAVKEMYQKNVWNNYVKKGEVVKEEVFDTTLFNDFRFIIEVYSRTQEGYNHFGPAPFEYKGNEVGKQNHICEWLKELHNDPQKSSVARIKESYKEGYYRIRDMRAYAEGLSASEMTKEEIATALQSVQALKEVNESRSFLWKVFHPFRNNAEQRDAKYIEEVMTKKINTMQKGQQNPKDIQWYKDFAKDYSPLLKAIQKFENEKNGVQEVADDNEIKQENELSNEKNREVILEKINERKSITITLENEEMKLDKSPFIQGRSMSEPVINNNK